MTDLNPFDPAKLDAKNVVTQVRHKVVDLGKTYVTAALLKTSVASSVALVAAALNFPLFAFVAVAVAVVASAVYIVYATKIMKAQDRANRWAYVGDKRVQQRNLEAKIAMDTVTLALMGERHAPGVMRSASSELRAALAYQQHRLRLAEERAEAAEAVKDGTASDSQRRTLKALQRGRVAAPPTGPAVEPIKARRAKLDAERKELEAEIKALATADSIVKAMENEEVKGARRTRRELEKAATEADQAARDRVRKGKSPTTEQPEHGISIGTTPNGANDVQQLRPTPTPEQIARGDEPQSA